MERPGARLLRLYGPAIFSWTWERVRTERIVLAVVLCVACALWAFFAIAEEVLEGETHRFDRALLLALRAADDPGDPIGPRWVEEVARDITGLGSTVVLTLITAATITFLVLTRRRGAAWLVLVSVGGGGLLSSVMKLVIDRSRPDLVPHAVEVYTASFPSGHAMLSAATYLTLGALLARVESSWRVKVFFLTVAVLITVMVGISRVYLGVHWPTDVMAGWSLGAAWALLCWLVALWLQRRGQVEPDVQHAGLSSAQAPGR